MPKELTIAYIYKYGFLYVGWIFRRRQNDTPIYYDNVEYTRLFDEKKITYLCFAFTKRGALKRIDKRLANGKKAGSSRLKSRRQ